MKITLEQYGVKYTIEDECDSASISEVVDHLYGLLLNAGYSPDIVADAFIDKGEEMLTHPETEPCAPDEIEFQSSFDDESFLRRHAKIVPSRYGTPRYFYKLEEDELLYQFFDKKNVNSEKVNGSQVSYKCIEPSGGPYLKAGETNLGRDICPSLPYAEISSIEYDNQFDAYRIKLVNVT